MFSVFAIFSFVLSTLVLQLYRLPELVKLWYVVLSSDFIFKGAVCKIWTEF